MSVKASTLTLASTLSELLADNFDRSSGLDDGSAVVQFLDPVTLSISWPLAEGDQAHSMIYVKFQARAMGGARIGNWDSGPPQALPVIASLTPSTAPAGADVSVTIAGTGLADEATVNVGSAYGLVPTSQSDTSLAVLIEAVNIEKAGTLVVSVETRSGESNALDFVVT